jgi:hypothetical protein
MTAVDLGAALRSMFANMHGWLDGTFQDVTEDQARWHPSGRVVPAGAHYAHHVMGAEDMMLNMMIRGTTPLAFGECQGRTGVSEPLPMGPWDEWARRIQIDLPALRAYAKAVYANTDAYLATVTPKEWERLLDLTPVGMGHQTVGYLLTQILLDGGAHCGEISAVKGLQGLQGYPF